MASRVTTEVEGHVLTSAEFYSKTSKWASAVRGLAKQNVSTFTKGKTNPGHEYSKKSKLYAGKVEKKLISSLQYVVKKQGDVVDYVGYKFPLHGIFRAWGVGQGQPRDNERKKAFKIYVKRTPSNWLDDPLDLRANELADIAVEYYGDQAVTNIWGSKIKKS